MARSSRGFNGDERAGPTAPAGSSTRPVRLADWDWALVTETITDIKAQDEEKDDADVGGACVGFSVGLL